MAEIEIAAAALAPADQLALLEWLRLELASQEGTSPGGRPRTPGLGAGAWFVADE